MHHILVVNLGSSSGKFSLFAVDQNNKLHDEPVWSNSVKLDSTADDSELANKLQEGLKPLSANKDRSIGKDSIIAVGHRVVHGAHAFKSSVIVTDQVKEEIRSLEKFSPLHNRLNLLGIETLEREFSGAVKQIASFDTTFHHTLPEHVSRYPIPDEWYQIHGIRRYGFHGISNAYAVERVSNLLKIESNDFTGIVCHLGSGCSITAIQNGKSVDTSMGFTPLEGLMMGTRSGSIDPAIPLFMMREAGASVEHLDRALNHESGLTAISGLPNDMRAILEQAANGNEKAKLAVDMFVYRLQSYIGAYYVHLTDPRVLVFTGGIGENSAEIRKRTFDSLGNIGCAIDLCANEKACGDADISSQSSKMKTFVVIAREDLFIAKETLGLISSS